MNPKQILTKELLEEEYIKNKLSTKRIAEKYNIKSDNSVAQAIERHGLYRENLKDITNKITKEWLYQKYIVEDLSALDIAKSLGIVRKASILAKLHEFNIPIRKNNMTKKGIQSAYNRRSYNDIHMNYWASLRTCAKKRGLEFLVSIEYGWELFIKQDRKCAISNLELKFRDSCSNKKTQTASLDRIDSSKGYIEGNVQWVHKVVNRMKWDLDQKDLVQFCCIIADFSRGKI